ncbi:AI-2E family transporter [Candidatus Wolfebacteria bacterium]|nr:AI-2E family transporter [Candidatus Wolfebacteria bacterium]
MQGTRISIDPFSVLKGALVLVLLYVLFLLRDLVLVVLTAIVIASAIEPGTRWFMRHRVPRLIAVVLIYLIVAVILFGVFYFLLPPLLADLSGFLAQVPEYLGSFEFLRSFSPLDSFDAVGSQGVVDGIRQTFSARDVVQGVSQYLVDIPGGVFGTVSAVFGGVLSFVLIVVISFYLSVQEGGIDALLRIIVPFRHQRYAVDLWRRAQGKIGKWMQGQLLLMLIVGVLVFLGLTILGVEHALLFAILAALFELIPVFGPILSSIPAIAAGFIDGGLTLALIIAGVYIIIQQFENHLIYPLVVHKVVGVPALLVILALIVGAQLAGFLGIILAVPLATALMEFTNDIEKGNRSRVARETSA